MRVTTPQDFDWDYPATGGALYGQASHGWMASFRRPGARSRMPGLYLAGGQCASGAGRADGGDIGPAGSAGFDAGSRFDQPVPHNGYAWWYVDGLSDDGRYGLTVIAFIGSVFSPYYARARRRGDGRPFGSLRDQRRALRSARQALGHDRARPAARSRVPTAIFASGAAP